MIEEMDSQSLNIGYYEFELGPFQKMDLLKNGEVSELVECAALEMRCTLLMCTVGSNPTLSANPPQ